ncbi:porin [Catenovulum sediminis]|uniref:porin n=1 Tax=Catenovulum sediminis TaxID=1740262 RepID=UPI00163D98E8|nr:porin [Catenovulum sediminis]
MTLSHSNYTKTWLVLILFLFSHTAQSEWFNYKGRVQLDYDNTQLNSEEVTDKSAYRRVWLSFYGSGDDKGKVKLSNWSYLARFDLRADEFDDDAVVDLVVSYSGLGNGRKLTLGRQKTQFGMNWVTGNTALTFAERSGVANFHKLGRMEGMTYQSSLAELKFGGKINYWLGVYDKSDFNGIATVGRMSYSYQIQPAQYVHLGGGIAVTGEKNLANLEFSYGFNAFHLQSEYFTATYDDANLDNTHGVYIEGGYFLDGTSSRPYKNGKYGRFKPKAKYGTLQLIARIEQGDGNFNQVELGNAVEARAYSLGLNWYLTSQASFMSSYMSAEQTQQPEHDGQELRLRGQFVF